MNEGREVEDCGLEYFEIRSRVVEDADWRLDATSYDKTVLEYLELADSWREGTVRLKDAATEIFNLPRFKRVYATPDEGWPYLSPADLFLFRVAARKYMSKTATPPNPTRFFAKSGWLLITCSGTLGRVRLATERTARFFLSHDLIRFVPGADIPVGYVYAFLCSRYGQAILRGPAYGMTVDHIEPHHIKDVPLVLVEPETQQAIHEKVSRAAELRDEASRLEDEAIQLFEERLDPGPDSRK